MPILALKKGPSLSAKAQVNDQERHIFRWNMLKDERSSWIDHWRDIGDNISTRRARFLTEDRNKGYKKNEKIINTTPIIAHRTLASGMMAGITSPSREWFRLTLPDPDLADKDSVKEWLHEVELRIRTIYAKSNWYDALSGGIYPDLGAFGTSCAFIEEDHEDVIRVTSLPIGSYALAANSDGRVDTVYREFSYTVAQMVDEFGYDQTSDRVQRMYDEKQWDFWVVVLHVVEPNGSYDSDKADYRGMQWSSTWYEMGGGFSSGGVVGMMSAGGDVAPHELRKSGYPYFPAVCPRWGVTGEDIYGWAPGMDALSDCKVLQLYEKRKAQLLDKLTNPSMQGPTALKAQRASSLPGDITYVDGVQGEFKPSFVPPPNAMQYALDAIHDVERRIEEIFFADLWLMISNAEQTQPITAEEVRAKQEEKMLQLGPVLERLNNELLAPAVELTFEIMLRKGLIPPPPQEMQGSPIRVEFISILAQAQKLVGTTAVERLTGFAGTLSQVRPDVLDNLDVDKVIRKYADMLGVPPDMLRPEDAVAEVRAEKQKQQQAEKQGQAMLAATQGAKNLGQTDPNNVNQLLGQFAGAGQTAMPGGGAPTGAPPGTPPGGGMPEAMA